MQTSISIVQVHTNSIHLRKPQVHQGEYSILKKIVLQLWELNILLGLESSFSRFCTPRKVRFPRTLFPLFEIELFTNIKVVPFFSIYRTYLIRSLRPPRIMNDPRLPADLYLLDIHHQPREVHVLVEHRRPTVLFQISGDPYEEPAHLIPGVRH